MKLYVGNLSYEVSDEDLRQAFGAFGAVDSATVVRDMYTKQSKGFGFVEMPAQTEAQNAMNQLNGTEMKGRNINVNEARPRNDQRGGGGGRGQGGNWRGGGGGGGRSSRRSW